MSFRTVIVAVLALVCGLSAAFAVFSMRQPKVEAVNVTKVLVASVDIPLGTTVSEGMVKSKDWRWKGLERSL